MTEQIPPQAYPKDDGATFAALSVGSAILAIICGLLWLLHLGTGDLWEPVLLESAGWMVLVSLVLWFASWCVEKE